MKRKALLSLLIIMSLILAACTTNESPSNGNPKTVGDYLGYMPDFSKTMPASLSGQSTAKAVCKALYTGTTEPIIKTNCGVAGSFSGSGLLYGGFEETVLFIVNAIKVKMAEKNPAENSVVSLGDALYLGKYPFHLGKAKWEKTADGGAMVFCYNENVGGSSTVKNDFAFDLSPNGFKLFMIQENTDDPTKPRYVTCDYDATTKKYIVYTYDSSLTHQIATDYQAFVGEPLSDGSFRFFSRQWNDGEQNPEFYGLGYADASRGGYAVFYDKNFDMVIGPDSDPDEQARMEVYNNLGDSVYIAYAGATGEGTTAMGYSVKMNELYRLKYMTPLSGWTIDYDDQTPGAAATNGTSVVLDLGTLPPGTDLVTIGSSDDYGVFAQSPAATVPYITQVHTECLLEEHQDDRNFVGLKLTDMHSNWIASYNLAAMHSIIAEVPALSKFADLK